MTWTEGLGVAAFLLSLLSLGWQVLTWYSRTDDEKIKGEIRRSVDESVEKTKGEIRRDVEQSLKEQETRLRIEAELRLRLHDKAWGLLRDLLGAAYEAHRALADYVLLVAHMAATDDEAVAAKTRREGLHQRCAEVLARLQVTAGTVPPDMGAGRAATKFSAAFTRINGLTLSPPEDADRFRQITSAVSDDMRDGFAIVVAVTTEWNKQLWAAAQSERLVEPLRVRVERTKTDDHKIPADDMADALKETVERASKKA